MSFCFFEGNVCKGIVFYRLLVNLTNPALLLYREEVPVERTARHNYLQILSHLQSYKEEAFTKVENWQVFAKKLAKILEIVSISILFHCKY